MTYLATLLALCLTLIVEPGHVKRVLDGDSVVLFSVTIGGEERVRILDIDTPECLGRSRTTGECTRWEPLGLEAMEFTRAWLARGPFSLWACERDSFGRLLARIQRGQTTLADDLVSTGLARWR